MLFCTNNEFPHLRCGFWVLLSSLMTVFIPPTRCISSFFVGIVWQPARNGFWCQSYMQILALLFLPLGSRISVCMHPSELSLIISGKSSPLPTSLERPDPQWMGRLLLLWTSPLRTCKHLIISTAPHDRLASCSSAFLRVDHIPSLQRVLSELHGQSYLLCPQPPGM